VTPVEFPPELRKDTPAGTPQSETVEEQIADLFCPCAATVDPPPVWSLSDGYWKCSRPDLPGHDTAERPPTLPGQIPCQPVTTWNPADKPEAVLKREIAAEILDKEGLL
jgi:hypothetical protein